MENVNGVASDAEKIVVKKIQPNILSDELEEEEN